MAFDFNNPVNVAMSYFGTSLTTTLTQGANTWTDTRAVNLATVLGASTAYVGFAASSEAPYQVAISNFAFTPVPEPATGALALGSLGTLLLLRRRNR